MDAYPLPFMTGDGGLTGIGAEGLPNVANALSYSSIEEFFKALSAGTGVTDVAALTGGGALRRQSLEATLIATIQQNPDFRLWNMVDKSNATATIDEWTEETGIGGYPGGAFNDELGDITEQDAALARHTLQIKYLMTRRRVSFVKELEGGIQKASAVQQTAGALELLTSAEWGLFNGDAAIIPQEFDGLYKVVAANAASNIVDLRGQPIGNSAEEIVNACATINQFGNFGMASHGFWSVNVQGDLDKGLDPAFRVMLGGGNDATLGLLKGAPVQGIKSSFAYDGKLRAVYDKFILEGQPPASAGTGAYAGALNTGSTAPTTPTSIAGVNAGDAASKFTAAHAGLYYYGVAAITKDGQSAFVASSQVTVNSGDKVTLTITPGATNNAKGFIIYRSALNGGNTAADMREMVRVAQNATTQQTNTVYVDYNTDIPGTSKAFILNMTPGMEALTVRRLLPMMKFPLYPTTRAEVVWAQLLFFALRVAKPKQHVILKNVLPRMSTFRPFGV